MNKLKEELESIRRLYHYLLTVYQKQDVYQIDGLLEDLISIKERLDKVIKNLKDYEEWTNYDK